MNPPPAAITAASKGCSLAKVAAPTQINPPPAPLTLLPMEPILAEKKEPLADAVAGFGQVADWRNFILLPPLHHLP
jgi:hypothetical protein